MNVYREYSWADGIWSRDLEEARELADGGPIKARLVVTTEWTMLPEVQA